MAPRVCPPAQLNAEQRAQLDKTPPQPSGEPLNVFATLAHRPALLSRVNALGGYFSRAGTIPPRERELAILRTAARVRSGYEEAHHRVTGAELGMTPEEIEAAVDPEATHEWAAPDRALLRFVDEVLEEHTVSDATWTALDGVLDDVQRLELLVLVGFYAMLGGMLNAVGVELEARAG